MDTLKHGCEKNNKEIAVAVQVRGNGGLDLGCGHRKVDGDGWFVTSLKREDPEPSFWWGGGEGWHRGLRQTCRFLLGFLEYWSDSGFILKAEIKGFGIEWGASDTEKRGTAGIKMPSAAVWQVVWLLLPSKMKMLITICQFLYILFSCGNLDSMKCKSEQRMRLIWHRDSPRFKSQNNHTCAEACTCFVNVGSSKSSLCAGQSSSYRSFALSIDEKPIIL